MWLDMCKIVIPIVDKVVKRILAECLVVDVAELATYCSVGVLPLTCSANGVYANLPNKWSVHMVWKHGNRYLNDIAETRSIFDRVSSSLQRPLRDVLPAHFNPRLHDADASEMLISSILYSRVYTRNCMFRTVGCVKLGKEQRVLVPCQLTPTFKLHSGGIGIHVWQQHLVTVPFSHSEATVAASSRGACPIMCLLFFPGVRGGGHR